MDDTMSKSVIVVILALTIGSVSFVILRYILEKTFSLLVNVAVTVVVGVALFSYCDSTSHRCNVMSASTSIASAVDSVHVYVKYRCGSKARAPR